MHLYDKNRALVLSTCYNFEASTKHKKKCCKNYNWVPSTQIKLTHLTFLQVSIESSAKFTDWNGNNCTSQNWISFAGTQFKPNPGSKEILPNAQREDVEEAALSTERMLILRWQICSPNKRDAPLLGGSERTSRRQSRSILACSGVGEALLGEAFGGGVARW